MEAVLIPRWTAGVVTTPTVDDASVAVARERVRALGAEIGLSTVESASLVTAVSELARNQLRHARRGEVGIRAFDRDGLPGIEIIAADRGDGIADVARAMSGAGHSDIGLGIGFSGVFRLVDEVDVDVRIGAGTCIIARKLAAGFRRRREVAIFGRPHAHERISGDDATWVRDGDELTVAVADGLGHGPEARAAALKTIEVVHEEQVKPREILRRAHVRAAGTRGAVMAVVRIDERTSEMTHAAVGNLGVHLLLRGASRSFSGSAAVLGAPGASSVRVHEERTTIDRYETLVVCSDGVTSRAVLAPLAGERRHPIEIAHAIATQFGRNTDDVTVLVVR